MTAASWGDMAPQTQGARWPAEVHTGGSLDLPPACLGGSGTPSATRSSVSTLPRGHAGLGYTRPAGACTPCPRVEARCAHLFTRPSCLRSARGWSRASENATRRGGWCAAEPRLAGGARGGQPRNAQTL